MRVTEALVRGRVEAWQARLMVGDCFALVVHDDVIIYGRVLQRIDDSGLSVRTYCEALPDGADDVIESFMADLPMTGKQFAMAKMAGWPSRMKALRVIVGMARPGDA